jgi:hypothetical protein
MIDNEENPDDKFILSIYMLETINSFSSVVRREADYYESFFM